MTAAENEGQVAFWNGEVGQRWVRNQAMLDRVFAPLTATLLDRAGPRLGERVLDVGCGCGDLAWQCAERMGPGGHVMGVDVSAPMLAQARAMTASDEAVEWVEADASAHPFPDASFDLLISRFGVMFFDDPTAAFAHLRRALRPGGRLVILCWQALEENPWAAVPRAAVLRAVPPPEPSPPHAPGPFAFAEAGRVQAILAAAGFTAVGVETVSADLVLGRGPDALAEAARFALEVGPASSLVREASPDARGRAEAEVLTALRRHEQDGAVMLRARCWLYQAGSSDAV